MIELFIRCFSFQFLSLVMFVAHCRGTQGSETIHTRPVSPKSKAWKRRFAGGHRLKTTCDGGGRSDGAMQQVCELHHNKNGFTKFWTFTIHSMTRVTSTAKMVARHALRRFLAFGRSGPSLVISPALSATVPSSARRRSRLTHCHNFMLFASSSFVAIVVCTISSLIFLCRFLSCLLSLVSPCCPRPISLSPCCSTALPHYVGSRLARSC